MAHHAFFVEANSNEGTQSAKAYIRDTLQVSTESNPDVVSLSYSLFSVEHARELANFASHGPLRGDTKVIIVSVERLFHEAQNALLKLFEEPPRGTVLILVLPSAGVLLPTLRSRLLPLPVPASAHTEYVRNESAEEIIRAQPAEREKLIGKLLERAKSENDDVKQAARREALEILQALSKTYYASLRIHEDKDVRLFLEDLERFIPILYQRSAPLKLIFEHLQLVWPTPVDYTTPGV
jgi:DNA polymerase III delta prime subunit